MRLTTRSDLPAVAIGAAMRVAVVAEWYPSPADPVHGLWAHRQAVATAAAGAEIQVLALRRPVPPLALARRLARVPPDVAALGHWARGTREALRPVTLDGLAVHSVPWLGPPRPLSYGTWGWWMAPSLGVALARLYAAWPFDVLHAHTLAPAGQAAARWIAAARRFGGGGGTRPAFVVSGHGPDLFAVPDLSAAGRHAVRFTLATADLAIANSSWTAARCVELAGGPVEVEVVHLGATLVEDETRAAEVEPDPADCGSDSGPDSDFDPGSGPGHAAPRRLRLVTVAHLQERKHHHVVLRALARLPEATRPDYMIVGDGERRDALRDLATELRLGDRVRFLGQLPNEQAIAEAGRADLFVMPGVQEPFGVAFVEAMAAGVPAVGSRGEGGPQDIAAAGEGMLLVDADDDAELAALITELDGDRKRLARLGAAARVTARTHFGWPSCGEATLAAYERALALAP